jgi:hypothetical protein
VEVAPDAWGLNVAIGYRYSVVGENLLLYRRWYGPNGGLPTLAYMNGSDMRTSGNCEHKGTGHINTLCGILTWLPLAGGGGGGRALEESIEADDVSPLGGCFLRAPY